MPKLRAAYRARTARVFDNFTIVTGEPGTWKSLWIRKFGRYVDPTFTVEHIHFDDQEFAADFVNLAPGRVVAQDEWRAHKRLAMHGERINELDFNKEIRQMSVTPIKAYPEAVEVDNDLMKRFHWWHHKPERHVVEVREQVNRLAFDKYGKPMRYTRWPLVAAFDDLTGKNDPMRAEYEAKKDDRMKTRAALFTEGRESAPKAVPAEPPSLVNLELVARAKRKLPHLAARA